MNSTNENTVYYVCMLNDNLMISMIQTSEQFSFVPAI